MLEKALLEEVLLAAAQGGADFTEIFVESTDVANFRFYDQKMKELSQGTDEGAGIRALYGTREIYASTSDLSREALLEAAAAVAGAGEDDPVLTAVTLTDQTKTDRHPLYEAHVDGSLKERLEISRSADLSARGYDPRISQVTVSLIEKHQNVLIANSEGLLTTDQRVYTRIAISAIAEENGQKQTGSVSPGALKGYDFYEKLNPVQMGREASRIAITMLEADYAPSGELPVVIDSGFGGVIFHEACGHSLETTAVARNASVFADKMGQQIAHPAVTAIDDGTINHAWGSTNVDDEGMPTKRTVLIEKGVLKAFMCDRLGERKTGYPRSGSGRRQSYRFAPTSRMRNTYIASGEYTLEELIGSIDYGLYAAKMGGGSVSPGTGDFNFAVAEGYMIRDGKIAEPVRGATLIGNGADTLMKISMVANNMDRAQGMCGSVSGAVPTEVGQPAVKVDKMLIGGRKEA